MAAVRTIALALPAALLLLATAAVAREPAPVRQAPGARVTQQGMLEMLNEMEQLQREVQQLRGEVEVQSHTIEQMRRQQRQQYVDIDRRINGMERSGGAPPVPAPEPIEQNYMQPAPIEQTYVPPVETIPPEPAAGQPQSDTTAIGSVADNIAYREAKGLLNDGQYAPAVSAFRQFLATYPNSVYTDNAQYWLAETYYKTRQYKAALDEFLVVITDHPSSPKALDSKLKVGYIYYELKDWELARRALTEVQRQSPTSTTGRLARQRLDRMERERH